MGRRRLTDLAAKVVEFAFGIRRRADANEDHGCAALLTRLGRAALGYACHAFCDRCKIPNSASTVSQSCCGRTTFYVARGPKRNNAPTDSWLAVRFLKLPSKLTSTYRRLSSVCEEHYDKERVGRVARMQQELKMLKHISILAVASAALFALPAMAEEVGVGVGVGPVGAGVTVGSSHDRVVREREVIREREPRDKVIIKKERRPDVVEKKTIIKERD